MRRHKQSSDCLCSTRLAIESSGAWPALTYLPSSIKKPSRHGKFNARVKKEAAIVFSIPIQ
jgi:hypothetical protein